MRAASVMTSPVVTVPARTPVRAAAALLASHGFTAAPVVDQDGRLLGVITEADLIRDRVRHERWRPRPERSEPTVGQTMTAPPVTMRPDDDLADVVDRMLRDRIRVVPILQDGVLVGIVSRRDVLRLVARGGLVADDAP